MATISSSTPISLQLRLGRCRQPAIAAGLVRLRLRLACRRVRLESSPGRWLMVPVRAEAAPDSFAGWAEEGSEEEKGGGFLGAGLAGVLFIAGVAFAAFSLKNKITGVKPQMESLTREQAVAVCSYDNSKDGGVGEKSNEGVTHIDGKNDSYLESVREPPLQNHKPASDEVNAIGQKASQEKGPIALDVIDSSTPDASNLNLPEVSEAPVDFLSDSPLKNAVNNDGSNSPDPSNGHNVNPGTISYDHEGGFNQEEIINSEVPLTLPSVLENQHPVENLNSDAIILDSGDVIPIKEISQDAIDSASSSPKDQGILHNDNVQPSSNTSQSYPELSDKGESSPSRVVHNLEFDQSEAWMLPNELSSVPQENGKLANGVQSVTLNDIESALETQIDESQLFESLAREKSFSRTGIPAPSLLSAALQVPPGKVLVPAVVDQTQDNALAALQVLKVIEPDAQPGDLCTRREYARWLVVASNCLSRNAFSKVYPAMYVENMTELAFDDVTPEDPDFPCIQGLAEAGLISSKLSATDENSSVDGQKDCNLFFPESPLSRQDLVSWKMALEKTVLPEVDRNSFYRLSGYIDIDKINSDAWPALAADLAAGEHSITSLAFGFTRLFQPDKPVTKGQAALAISTGDAAEVVSEELARIEAEKMAETAVNAHSSLVAEVEEDMNASFERELIMEREKIDALEKLAEEARLELEKLRAEREEEKNALIKGRAAVESEMEVLSKMRGEAEEQLESLLSNKVEISFEKDRISKIQKQLEVENQAILQLQYELEVERKALSMARAWAEEEAKKATEQVRALEEARFHWERQGIKVVVDGDLRDDAATGITWATAGKEHLIDKTIHRAESLKMKLKLMAAEIKVRSSSVIGRLIQHVTLFISTLKRHAAEATGTLKQQAVEANEHCRELGRAAISRARKSADELRVNASAVGSTVQDRAKRVIEDCKEGVEKITHRFKT